MTTLGELLKEEPAKSRFEETTLHVQPESARDVSFPPSSRDEQIYGLVQQLFFRHLSGPIRSVGFTAVEAATDAARLCFDAAKVLVEEGKYDIGLIDAGFGQVSLADQLQVPSPANAQGPWALAQRLWLVPSESWCLDGDQQPASHSNLERLREYVAEFDFSIVCCPPISWVTARIGQVCDGVVLVLAANRTRRLVAAQIKQQLIRAHVPLLGTVLAERHFPVPSRLYRSL